MHRFIGLIEFLIEFLLCEAITEKLWGDGEILPAIRSSRDQKKHSFFFLEMKVKLRRFCKKVRIDRE
jgi:hypothetical protein